MGLSSLNPFSSSSSSTTTPQTPKPSSDGAFIAPDRTSRAKCYEARDAFFNCLDKNGILDAIKEKDMASKACGGAETAFGKECAGSWVCASVREKEIVWKREFGRRQKWPCIAADPVGFRSHISNNDG